MSEKTSNKKLKLKSRFSSQSSLRKRKFLNRIGKVYSLPDLIEVQKKAYDWLIKQGIQELLEEISPISDYTGKNLDLNFKSFYLDEPKYDERTAKERNISYEAPIRMRVVLQNKQLKKEQEQEIYLGEFPLMTKSGTFIINGVERVVVSQLIRSPGVFFTVRQFKGRNLFGAKVIPNRGAWLEFETDSNDTISVKIDRKRKVPVTALVRVFGYSSNKEITSLFQDVDTAEVKYIEETLKKDISSNRGEGYKEVYKRIRPGDMATEENAKQMIDGMFFDENYYDLSRVGRYRMNARLKQKQKSDKKQTTLTKEDLINTIKEIIRLNNDPKAKADDIDHLGNRRVKSVGELVQNKLRIGFARMERNIKDRMSTCDLETVMPGQLINSRPVAAVVKEFFASSQLSQYMDHVNPLAELEHKRRLSAMGPGGLTRERASFEVRDVHQSHYGRICPIQTPEGPNIGLVTHLACYARVNEYGFLETPYRKVQKSKNGKVKITEQVDYLTAAEEEKYNIVQAGTPIDDQGFFEKDKLQARVKGEATLIPAEKADYVDISSKQVVSIATSLIPFLEHDDANRALMGSNMQRQAVSCIKPQAPTVGTGIEDKAAADSGQVVLAEQDGKVVEADADHIMIKDKKGKKHLYELHTFTKSNAFTCISQIPAVAIGDSIKKGQLLADGASTDNGELALGQNVLVAFVPWKGYNFEDAIVISERLVHNDNFSSIHIEDHIIDVRDTRLGPEIVTRDIPNIGEEKLKNLDEEGIVRVGAEVSAGDILVGKITPKGESDLTAEERLLRAIFGDKSRDIKDSSLYMPNGERCKVVDIKIFSREQGDKLPSGVIKQIQITVAQLRKIQEGDKLAGRHGNKGVIARILPREDMPYLPDGTPVDMVLNPLGVASRMNIGQILETHLGWAAQTLGFKVASPVLNGVSEKQIAQQLKKAKLPQDGKIQVINGLTGEPFKDRVNVGVMYIMKLNHLVEDKIHMRSIGPYSLITQQPLGGKAQFGGQRFGEMEVWALEGYGAAHSLQEILTIKSDDVLGRSKAYESIVKGEEIQSPNVPTSLHVLVNEMKGLCLDVQLLEEKDQEIKEEEAIIKKVKDNKKQIEVLAKQENQNLQNEQKKMTETEQIEQQTEEKQENKKQELDEAGQETEKNS
ncbi:MAG: DNA-directed RNA polymerase subunit beta [Candidatus Moranbacteria bacterium]|nr:DNA-directed RNA polymerase subunit beta [Candidatus Moranbacteria bacterium]